MKVLTTIFLLASSTSFSQTGGLKGHVIDNDQVPLAGARITLLVGDSAVASTVTDQHGDYEFKMTTAAVYNLNIEPLGYRNKVITGVVITASEIRSFDLTFPGPCIKSERICPKGHTDGLIPIAYGLPGRSLMKKARKGKVKLGGCIVTGCDPEWYCKKHQIEF